MPLYVHLLSGFSVQLILFIGQSKHPEGAIGVLGPRGQNVRKEKCKSAIIIKPPDIDAAVLPVLGLELANFVNG